MIIQAEISAVCKMQCVLGMPAQVSAAAVVVQVSERKLTSEIPPGKNFHKERKDRLNIHGHALSWLTP